MQQHHAPQTSCGVLRFPVHTRQARTTCSVPRSEGFSVRGCHGLLLVLASWNNNSPASVAGNVRDELLFPTWTANRIQTTSRRTTTANPSHSMNELWLLAAWACAGTDGRVSPRACSGDDAALLVSSPTCCCSLRSFSWYFARIRDASALHISTSASEEDACTTDGGGAGPLGPAAYWTRDGCPYPCGNPLTRLAVGVDGVTEE